jgi:iron complex transport system permease protein
MRRARSTAVSKPFAFTILIIVATVTALAAISLGSISIAPKRVIEVLFGMHSANQLDWARDALVIQQIRLPRLVLGSAVGAALAVSGAIMQGLFRNPLADQGLIGVSSGAGFAAAAAFVLG